MHENEHSYVRFRPNNFQPMTNLFCEAGPFVASLSPLFFTLRFAPIPRFSRLDLFHSLAAAGAPPLRLLPLSCRAVCTSKGQARKKREGGEGGKGV